MFFRHVNLLLAVLLAAPPMPATADCGCGGPLGATVASAAEVVSPVTTCCSQPKEGCCCGTSVCCSDTNRKGSKKIQCTCGDQCRCGQADTDRVPPPAVPTPLSVDDSYGLAAHLGSLHVGDMPAMLTTVVAYGEVSLIAPTSLQLCVALCRFVL